MTRQTQVFVKRLPERMMMCAAASFSREMKPFLQAKKPCIVFDCSEVRRLDSAGAAVLFECVDEVMKQDGDIKLAAVSKELDVILRAIGIDRIFEILDTVREAEISFRKLPLPATNSYPLFRWLASIANQLGQIAGKKVMVPLARSEPVSAR